MTDGGTAGRPDGGAMRLGGYERADIGVQPSAADAAVRSPRLPPIPAVPPSRRPAVPAVPWLNAPAMTAVLIWSGTFPIAKYALDEFHVLSYAAIRPLVAAALGFAVLAWRRDGIGIARADWPRLLVAGFCGMAAFQICFIVGLQRTSASHSALIASAAPPILGALVLWGLRGERPIARAGVGLALGFVGVALLVGDPNAEGASLAGDLISLGAALAWVVVTIVPASLVRRYGALRVSAWLILCAGVAFFPISLGALRQTARDVPSLLAWGSLFYTAILGMVTANSLWQRAVQTLGANRTMPYLYLQPLLALGLSAILLGERMGPVQYAGGLLAMVGVVLVNRR
jgi:drug/metabolite transporter (DMT)-like permease